MASPPFNPNQAVPADTDIVSVFPTAERSFRDIVESWLLFEHGVSGHHAFDLLTTAQRDADTTWEVGSLVFNTTLGSMQIVTSIGPVVWLSFGRLLGELTPQLGANLDANGFNIGFDDNTGILDDAGNEQVIFQKTAAAVNQLEVTNAATGTAPSLGAAGGDTDIDLIVAPKGVGAVRMPRPIDFAEVASPANPAANRARLHALNLAGTTVMAYKDSAGTEHILRSVEAVGALLGIIEERQTAGTSGGGGGAGAGAWQTRVLNTETYDRLGILSLAANQFTISAAGTYEIAWRSPFTPDAGAALSRLRNITDAATVELGSGAFSIFGDRYTQQWSEGIVRVTIVGSRTFEIQYFYNILDTTHGLGSPVNLDGAAEIYTRVVIRRG